MTNDTSFNSKSNPPSSIMEPIDETPSLISTVSKILISYRNASKCILDLFELKSHNTFTKCHQIVAIVKITLMRILLRLNLNNTQINESNSI